MQQRITSPIHHTKMAKGGYIIETMDNWILSVSAFQLQLQAQIHTL